MIDVTKPVQTRDGRPARIVSEAGTNKYPLIALVTQDDGRETPAVRTPEGKVYEFPGNHQGDLINIPEETAEFRNVYLKGFHSEDVFAEISHAYSDSERATKSLHEVGAPDSFTMKIERSPEGHIQSVTLWNCYAGNLEWRNDA